MKGELNKHAKATIGDVLRVVELVADELRHIHDKIAELDARPGFDYCGTYEQGRSYRRNQGCTQAGSIFVAMKDFPGIPGTPNCGWQLAVKRGRDSR